MTGASTHPCALTTQPMQAEAPLYTELIHLTRSLGATAALVLPVETMVVDERFAAMCGAPHRCPGYGQAPGCPPHAPSPVTFRAQLASYRHLLVFKIDAPVAELMGTARLNIARTIHQIAARVEQEAWNRGYTRARGMAAGSCKELFCGNETVCPVLTGDQPCRFPDLARPSISAVGIDFSALAAGAGWQFGKIESASPPDGPPAMGLMAGLVLLT